MNKGNNNEKVKTIILMPSWGDFWKYKINDLDWEQIPAKKVKSFVLSHLNLFGGIIQDYVETFQPFIIFIDKGKIKALNYDYDTSRKEFRDSFLSNKNNYSNRENDKKNNKSKQDKLIKNGVYQISNFIKNIKKKG